MSAGSSDNEEMFKKTTKGETKFEEQARLKAEFKQQAEASEDDDILVKKTKEDYSSSDEEERAPTKKAMNLDTDKDILQQLYGQDEKGLDNTDRFLRDFILKEGWKSKNDDDHYKNYQERAD